MYRRYYDGYSVPKEANKYEEIIVPQNIENTKQEDCSEITSAASSRGGGLFSSLPIDVDDLILIGILLFLLLDKDNSKCDDNNDIFMLLIIGVIIFSDIF